MLLRLGGNMNSKTLEISDELWSVAEKIIPLPIFKGKGSVGGRPNLDFRQVLTGIFFVLTTGCQWRRMPREFGHPSVVYKYFRNWVKAGIFDKIWTEALKIYDSKKGIDWSWQSIDGSNKKSQFGKENVDFNPKEKNKGGSKVMVLTDKKGIPLSTIVVPANCHESQLLEETLGNIRCERPHPREGIQNLCGDKAYDSVWCRESADEYGYRHHFRYRREKTPKRLRYKPKRWVVERTHAWLNRFRRIIIRWDVISASYEAFISLACASITLSRL